MDLFLGLLYIVDVLRYAGVVSTQCGNGRVEGDDVLGLSAAAAGS